MTDLKFSNYLITVLLIAVCVTSFLAFFSGMATKYGTPTDTSAFESSYNKIDEITNSTNELYDSSIGISADNDAQYFTGIWNAIKNTAKLMKNTQELGVEILDSILYGYLPFPAPIVAAIQAIFIILLVGAFIYLITKVRF